MSPKPEFGDRLNVCGPSQPPVYEIFVVFSRRPRPEGAGGLSPGVLTPDRTFAEKRVALKGRQIKKH
jgi:hypothetical protein